MEIFFKKTDSGLELTNQRFKEGYEKISHLNIGKAVKANSLNNSSSTRWVISELQKIRSFKFKRRKEFSQMKTKWKNEQEALPSSFRSGLYKA